MKRFTVDHVGRFLDIYAVEVTPAAQELLKNYLVGYFDASTALQEDLYLMDDFESAGIPDNAEGMEEVQQLAELAQKYAAAYIRLIDREFLEPVIEYAARQWEEIVTVAVLLSADYFNKLWELAGKPEKGVAAILQAWGKEFIDSYGVWPPDWRGADGLTFEACVKHWGALRLDRFKGEGK